MREYGPEAVAAEMAKAHAARAFGADYVAHILRQQQPRREVQPPLQLRDSARNELAPIRFRWPNTMLSFCVSERSPVTSLHQKRNQLSWTCMARQLDQTVTDAASKNHTFADTLESLVDGELQSTRQPLRRTPFPPFPAACPALH